jgi:hypothetical protein
MNIQDAMSLIASFSSANSSKLQAFSSANENLADREAVVAQLVGEKYAPPKELSEYIRSVCPQQGLVLEGVGHPVELLKISELSWQPEMLSPLTGELAKWQDDWFLIAHDGGDPIIIKASEQGENSPVYSSMQGMGFWDFAPIADSIGQFLVCACAIEHALNFPGLGQPLDDDFNLAQAAANWLFPFLRLHAGAHYDEWASVFENYQA